MNRFRILMNEADASPGGGAITPAPAQVPAQGAPAAPMTSEMIKEAFGEFRNGFFADLRKAGVFKQDRPPIDHPAPATATTTTGAPAAPSAGLSIADVQALIAKEGVAMTLAVKNDLTSTQTAHMKAALLNVPADQYETTAQTWLTEMGIAKTAAAQPATATQPVTATQAAPAQAPTPAAVAPSAPSGHGLPTQNGVIDLFSLTSAQLKDLGPSGVRTQLEKLAQIQQQAAGIPQRAKPPSQR